MPTDTNAAPASLSWTLERGQAQTFRPRTAGTLRVAGGRAWATLNPSPWSPQPRWCPEIDAGDLFLGPGNALPLLPGHQVVIESWPSEREGQTQLVWQATAPSPLASRWRQGVVQPARELGAGLAVAGRTLRPLLQGVLSFLALLLTGRSQRQHCNQPRI